MSSAISPITPDARIFIAGHRGLVGSALWRHFRRTGLSRTSSGALGGARLARRSRNRRLFAETRPDVVIDAAAAVGGIQPTRAGPPNSSPTTCGSRSIYSTVPWPTELNGFCSWARVASTRSSRTQPIREDALLTGPLEETNEGFAMAKLAGVAQLAAIRRQHGLPYICAMPTNLYGPGDNFNTQDSHVLPAMIRRFHQAVRDGARQVTCWGTGRPRREFLYVDDFADACHFLLDSYDEDTADQRGNRQGPEHRRIGGSRRRHRRLSRRDLLGC